MYRNRKYSPKFTNCFPLLSGSGLRKGGKPRKAKQTFYRFGKIYEVETTILHKVANFGYNVFMIVTDFTKKIVWFGTCFAFMFVFPYGFLHFTELMSIQSKIEMNQKMAMGLDEPMSQGHMRPF